MPTLAWACNRSRTPQHAHASVGMAPVTFDLPDHYVQPSNSIRPRKRRLHSFGEERKALREKELRQGIGAPFKDRASILVVAPRQVGQRLQAEQSQEAVRGVIRADPPLAAFSLNAQESAVDQLREDVAARLPPPLAHLLGGDRLLIGDDRQHVDGRLRQPRLTNPPLKAKSQVFKILAEDHAIAAALFDDMVRAAARRVAAVELFDQFGRFRRLNVPHRLSDPLDGQRLIVGGPDEEHRFEDARRG